MDFSIKKKGVWFYLLKDNIISIISNISYNYEFSFVVKLMPKVVCLGHVGLEDGKCCYYG